ncbi:thiol-disulfide isomerase/thioredoxin [Allocatelliglobosispora scoriae]|uniref:Thiol-disulfide isomerase/thioredoxin n=1 Tax=Allocatelliglobosispora scoriae TaxID=643052 RepID=A0A841BVP1_9ACTN|nr:thiol-disulfide isomerase/thioredoxin [Allocatelliglobosispora scoriae]
MVDVRALRGPMVINMWASWCAPCREELPAFERLARKTGAPKVVGVVDTSTRAAAVSVAEDLGVSFPMLFDDRSRFNSAMALGFVPATIFVDEAGRIAFIYRSVALDDASLGALVEKYL